MNIEHYANNDVFLCFTFYKGQLDSFKKLSKSAIASLKLSPDGKKITHFYEERTNQTPLAWKAEGFLPYEMALENFAQQLICTLDYRLMAHGFVDTLEKIVFDSNPTTDELNDGVRLLYQYGADHKQELNLDRVQFLVEGYGQRPVLEALLKTDGSTQPSHELGIEDLTAIIEMCTKRINEMSD